jgi:SAM-dependent methyltransferase
MPQDIWASGDAYEPFIGRWSRLVAREFLGWLGIPAASRWLDVGCGTGAVSQLILEHMAPTAVTGIDPSEGYVTFAQAHIRDSRAHFQVGDAQQLPVPDASFEAVVSGLVLNFVPEPALMAAEMARATRPGGTVAAYVWDYGDQMQILRAFWDTAATLDPAAVSLDEGQRFPLCRPEPLALLFREAHMQQVETRAIEVPTLFRDFEDYWTPFLGGQGPAPGYAMSLDEARRAVLREHLRARLPSAADGTIPLVARAWAVRGVPA